MCGRYVLGPLPPDPNNPDEQPPVSPEYKGDGLQTGIPFEEVFGVSVREEKDVVMGYNITPSQKAMTIPNDGQNEIQLMEWYLLPSWTKDPGKLKRQINARAETIGEKPMFRNAIKRQRCLVPATGYYEWKPVPGQKTKQPYFIHLKSHFPFAFAGIWERWTSPEGEVTTSFAIVTTEPNEVIANVHHRMPVILTPDMHQDWISTDEFDWKNMSKFFHGYPADAWTYYPISTAVNYTQNDGIDLLKPVESQIGF